MRSCANAYGISPHSEVCSICSIADMLMLALFYGIATPLLQVVSDTFNEGFKDVSLMSAENSKHETADIHLAVLLKPSENTNFERTKQIADYLKMVEYPDDRSKTSKSFFARWLMEIGKQMVLQTFDMWAKEQGMQINPETKEYESIPVDERGNNL